MASKTMNRGRIAMAVGIVALLAGLSLAASIWRSPPVVAAKASAQASSVPVPHGLQPAALASEERGLPGTWVDVPAAAADAPLVLGLHGRGDTAEHFAAVAGRFGNRLAYRFLAAPLPFKGGTTDGRKWFRSNDDPVQTRADIETLYPLIAAHARAARPRPVALLGFSQGCMVAAHFAIAHPDLVQAVLCLGGGLKFSPPMPPPGPRPAVLFVHAAEDPMVPIAGARTAARQMDNRGFATEFLEHSEGHSIPEAETERMRGWLERHLGLR